MASFGPGRRLHAFEILESVIRNPQNHANSFGDDPKNFCLGAPLWAGALALADLNIHIDVYRIDTIDIKIFVAIIDSDPAWI